MLDGRLSRTCGQLTVRPHDDMHVAAGSHRSDTLYPFPTGCLGPTTLVGQQLLWEFLFFDRSTCVTAGRGPVPPPKP